MIIAIVDRLDRALDEVMVMVTRIRNRATRIPKEQLRVSRDDCVRGKRGDN